MRVVNNILDLVGQTPVIKLHRMSGTENANIYVKLESFNPAGSIKDRPGLYMIEKAESEGLLNPESVILEATSGNTGIGLAMAAVIKGYPIVIVMPENMSAERKKILQYYGAELVLTPAAEGMPGAVERARIMAENNPQYYLIKQFENIYNAESHELSTAAEILEQMGNDLAAIICGVGSGGTITGIAKVLKKALPDIIIAAVEPANSAVLSGKPAGPHKIAGIGAGFIPEVLNTDLIDKIITVTDNEAVNTCRELARKEALLLGISSGAAVFAAINLAETLGRDKKILAIAPDGVDKYMSTELFD